METILLAVDGSAHSARAVHHVTKLGKMYQDIEVTILNVQPPIHDWQMHGVTREHVAKYHAESAAKILGESETVLRSAGIRTHRECRHADDPGSMIAQIALEKSATMIVMGSRGMGVIASLALGSTAQKVIQLSTVPVLIIK